jgi:hypothetical protein
MVHSLANCGAQCDEHYCRCQAFSRLMTSTSAARTLYGYSRGVKVRPLELAVRTSPWPFAATGRTTWNKHVLINVDRLGVFCHGSGREPGIFVAVSGLLSVYAWQLASVPLWASLPLELPHGRPIGYVAPCVLSDSRPDCRRYSSNKPH